MKQPKISVIMGVYNCQSYREIERSVQSIIAQTYSHWELIICDDGSTNETPQWLKKIGELDQRIHIIGYKKNQGLAHALNECLKVCTGDFIARQDTSDYSYPERFMIELEELEKTPGVDFVSCAVDLFDEQNGIWGQSHPIEFPQKKDFLFNSPFAHPGLLCPIHVIRKVSGYRSWRQCEDYDLFMRIYALGFKGKNILQSLYAYEYPRYASKDKRPFPIRLVEAKLRWEGFKQLRILFPMGIIYVAKPLLLSLLPVSCKNFIKGIQMRRK